MGHCERKFVIPLLVLSIGVMRCKDRSPSGGNLSSVEHRRAYSASQVARGQYLVEIAQCLDCHSPLDDSLDPQPRPDLLGAGDVLNEDTGLVAPNITPDAETGAGAWTDFQLRRALREGIGHDGRRLSLQMPWNHYSVLTDGDTYAIVAYLRSLKPVRHKLPASTSRLEEDAVKPVAPAQDRDLNTPPLRGAYLARLARCIYCHSPRAADGISTNLAKAFSGGRRFVHRKNWYVDIVPDLPVRASDPPDPATSNDLVTSPNLTSHASGLKHYDSDMFIRTIRSGKVNGVRQLTGAMPWAYFSHMSDEDLRAIFAYLLELPPVNHYVSNSERVSYCKVCKRWHGGGEFNRAVP